ncbi:hypothetical protein IFT37_08410 [Pseudomonas fluorescens]|uniref:hypothetical protein n=1 Tax=Pseudomonas fluorescens TaxID=294 RepID=UPI00177D037C|nr:hypothetical protein [Pseudomonas fluorescens]MBD8148781.1 hypothetical protein [Pseudomonas fluorescens]MBD8176266.1 hypothetical protein [Pseudomonas fluorescens]MBD8745125.1 hypothetical protein [Pseudomonas fluorescens]MBD8748911.1 hypothetical protein [Pseudomonas fluorescens]MBD8757809.1 hypothetical protein [Pseudomonas fluorescens]
MPVSPLGMTRLPLPLDIDALLINTRASPVKSNSEFPPRWSSWEAEHVVGAEEKKRSTLATPLRYRKSGEDKGFNLPPVDRAALARGPLCSKKSADKYNMPQVGLVSEAGMETRIARYARNPVLPDFIYNFLTETNDQKFLALRQHPEQFPATPFTSQGGIVLMPNTRYIEKHPEIFPQPMELSARTRHTGGYALVGYWIPPDMFEHRQAFQEVFKSRVNTGEGVNVRERVGEYERRTKRTFLVNPIDVQKEHLELLKSFRDMSLRSIEEVFGYQPGKDTVQMYLHSPIYGDSTAGLHIHVRVNQRLPAGEADAGSIALDKMIDMLEDKEFGSGSIKSQVLDMMPKTRSGLWVSFNSATNKKQFEGIPVRYVSNPWKQPG